MENYEKRRSVVNVMKGTNFDIEVSTKFRPESTNSLQCTVRRFTDVDLVG